MVRTQIQLTDEQAQALKQLSAQREASVAALVREAVGRLLAGESGDGEWRRALAVVGGFSSGRGDVAEEHDRHLEQAYLG